MHLETTENLKAEYVGKILGGGFRNWKVGWTAPMSCVLEIWSCLGIIILAPFKSVDYHMGDTSYWQWTQLSKILCKDS